MKLKPEPNIYMVTNEKTNMQIDERQKELLDLAERDKRIRALETKLNELRTYTKQTKKRLREQQRENELLEGVLGDYERHNKYVLSTKEEQKEQIQALMKYLDKAMEDSKLTDYKIREAKNQKNRLLVQLDQVKSEIDELLNEKI